MSVWCGWAAGLGTARSMILRITAESPTIRTFSLRKLRSWWGERVQIRRQRQSQRQRRTGKIAYASFIGGGAAGC
jgi:polyferredoxin